MGLLKTQTRAAVQSFGHGAVEPSMFLCIRHDHQKYGIASKPHQDYCDYYGWLVAEQKQTSSLMINGATRAVLLSRKSS